MKQVITIHGADAFPSREAFLDFLKSLEVTIDDFKARSDWKVRLPEVLGSDYDVLAPRMPNKNNARYDEWVVWFEKMLPFVTDDCILIGHSMGGIFLARYLSENGFQKRIDKLILVAAPHHEAEDLGDFILTESISNIAHQCNEIHLFHSTDDPVVPPTELGHYKTELPNAIIHEFSDRGHFNQDEFPELVKLIQSV